MHQPWLFHASGCGSQLTNKIAQECGRVTSGIINTLMQINARIVVAVLMTIAIFIFNPAVALAGLVIFTAAYMAMYRIVRQRLIRNGGTITASNRMLFIMKGEGFGGIKAALSWPPRGIYRQISADQFSFGERPRHKSGNESGFPAR